MPIPKRTLSVAVISSVMVLLLTGTAMAFEMEYYTYNGFDAIVGAFQKAALIFGDNGYKTLFFSVIVLGIMIGGLGMVTKAVGGRFSPAAWAMPIGLGILIYLALIVPKGTLHIYDPVKNRTQAVGGLPDGIVAVAGMLNLIERGLVEIVSTSADPQAFQTQAGGVGFDMLLNLGSNGVLLTDKTIHASLNNYTKDCLIFELMRPKTKLTVNQISKNTNFLEIYEEAAAPAIYTVYYPPGGGDEAITCQEAWTKIKTSLVNINTYDDSIKSRCADAGFDPTNPMELQQCRATMENLINWLQGASYETVQVYQQTLLAHTFVDTLISVSPNTTAAIMASRSAGNSMLASGVVANSWIPAIRAVITAVAIGLVPFMVLFIPTPLASKAIGIVVGFFVWLTAWGVTDAIVHQFAMDYGKKAFDEVTRNQLGLTAIVNFSTASMKTLAAFASIRWSGIMLATVITGMLIRFGGHALAQLSGQVTATPQGAARSAGMAAATPDGRASAWESYVKSGAAMTNAYKYRYEDHVKALAMEKMAKTRYGMDMADNFGGVEGAAEMKAAASVGRDIGFGARGMAMRDGQGGYQGALSRNTFTAHAGEVEKGNIQNIYGNDARGLANRKTAAEEVFVGMAKERGMSAADMQKGFSQLDFGATMNMVDKYARKTGKSFTEAAKDLGEILGSQKYVGASGYENARGVVSEEGMIRTATNKHLNEAAKFEMTYQLAHSLGLAQNKDDYAGMYQHHKMHHGEDSLTLTDQKAVNTLNQRMGSMGYSTRFQVGDRIRMNFDKDGNVLSAHATRGASRDSQDITREVKGYHSQYLNLTESRTGYRGEHGYTDTTYNYKRTQGVEWKQTGKDKDGKETYGWVVNDAYYNKDNGELVSQTWTNKNTGHTTGVRWVETGKTDDNGNAIKTPQFFSGTTEYDKNGRSVISNVTSISNVEFDKNGYHTVQKASGATGQVLHETNRQGQDATRINKLVIDEASEFRGNAGNIPMQGDDKTAVNDKKALFMMTTSMVDKGTKMIPQVRNVQNTWDRIKGPANPEGSAPGSPNTTMNDWQAYARKVQKVGSEKADHKMGNYGTRPSPPRRTTRPSSSMDID